MQKSPLTFDYVILNSSSSSSVQSSCSVVTVSDVPTVRHGGRSVTARRSVTTTTASSLITDPPHPPSPRCAGLATPDVPSNQSSKHTDNVSDCASVVDRRDTSVAECNSDKTTLLSACDDNKTDSKPISAAASRHSTPQSDHDPSDCLSISTSVTVVISRRAASTSSAAAPSTDQPPTDTTTASQLVLNTTIPAKLAPNLPPQAQQQQQRADVDMSIALEGEKPTQGGHDSSTSPRPTSDVVGRGTSGASRAKRKSLESVIKSLQPTPVLLPEVVRSRPEVLVRPMLSCAAARPNLHPVATQAVRPSGSQPSMLYSQPGVVDLRRPKRPAPTASHGGPGPSRRKPKSLSPIHAPPYVDVAHLTDKRRRFNSSLEAPWPPPSSTRFGCYFRPTPGPRGQAAVAARYHVPCMHNTAARPDVSRLPVYYGGISAPPQRAEPNGYDAPLELTTKRPRDRS